jgi:hypothetical protein
LRISGLAADRSLPITFISQVSGVAVLAFVSFFALLDGTIIPFRRVGYERAFAFGIMVSQSNVELIRRLRARSRATWQAQHRIGAP